MTTACSACGSTRSQLRHDMLLAVCVNRAGCRQRIKALETSANYAAEFEPIFLAHPLDGRVRKRAALLAYVNARTCGATAEEIAAAHERYLKHLQGNAWKSPQNADTWFRNWRDWQVEPEPAAEEAPAEESMHDLVLRVAENLVYPWIREHGHDEKSADWLNLFNDAFDRTISWPDGFVSRWDYYLAKCLKEGISPAPTSCGFACRPGCIHASSAHYSIDGDATGCVLCEGEFVGR